MNAPRHAIALFLAIFTIFFTGPVAAQPPSAPVISGPMRIAVSSAPKTLSPSLATDAAAARLLQLTHPALLAQTPGGTAPLVATACAWQNNLTYACQLPTGTTYSDGTPLTAGTVADWLHHVQHTNQSPLSALLGGITIAAQNNNVTFTLQKSMPGLPEAIAQVPLANPANQTAGAGAYKLGTPDAQGNVTLTPINPHQPALQFLVVADPTTRLLKLQKGEVDVLQNDLPPELVKYAQEKKFNVQSIPGSSYTYIAYNFRNADLANPQWRAALAMSTNRAALRNRLLGGQAQPAGSLLPPGGPATWEAPEEQYDPRTVADTLDESLLPDGEGTRVAFTLTTSTDPTAQRIAQVLQQQWAQIGVKLTIRPVEWAALYDAIRAGRFDMVLLTWTGLQNPDFLYNVFDGSQLPPRGFNRGHVNDDALNQTLDALHNAPTAGQQAQLAIAAQKQIAALRPYLPLFRRNQTLITSPKITGCTINMQGNYQGLTTCRK